MTLPPPTHGSAVVSRYIMESAPLNEAFRMDVVNLSTSRGLDEIGGRGFMLMLRKLWRFLSSFFRAFRLLAVHRYDLCYLTVTCHGSGFLKDAPFVLLCKLFHRKILLHHHNTGMAEDTGRWPYSILLPFVYRNTKVMLLSWRLYPDIGKVVPRESVMVCANGIPQVSVVPDGRCSSSVVRLLFLGNLLVSKGIFVLLDACGLLAGRGLEFSCSIVGGESSEMDRSRIEKEIKSRGLDGKVRYYGPRYGEEKESFWKDSDIFVFPTMDEAFPLVALEAMQHRLPVITTDVGGIPDFVKDGVNGFLCHQGDASMIADGIMRLVNDAVLLRSMGDAGYEIYSKDYTLDAFYKRFEECVKSAF